MAITTAKSAMMILTMVGKKFLLLIRFNHIETRNVPMKRRTLRRKTLGW